MSKYIFNGKQVIWTSLILLFLFHVLFIVPFVVFDDVFEEHFWRYNGPPPNFIFSALYFKHSLLSWRLKFMEMTEYLQNWRLSEQISLITLHSNVKIYWKIIKIKGLFCSGLTLRKRHILRLRRLVMPCLTKRLIIYLNKY